MKITEQDVQRVADLANLALTAEEITRMTRDLDGILGHIDKLNELDATLEMSDVQPMSQVLFEAGETATLRPDVEVPPLSNAEAMANAPVSGGGYFKVPRVIDRG